MLTVDRLLNRLVNPVVRAILRSPLHRLLGRGLVLLEWEGRRTGMRRSVPVQFVREGDVLVLTSRTRRVWWRNFVSERPVRIVLDGQRRTGSALASVEGDAVTVRVTLAPAPPAAPTPRSRTSPRAPARSPSGTP